MTGRVFDDAVVEAAARAIYDHDWVADQDPQWDATDRDVRLLYTESATAALSAAADALEGGKPDWTNCAHGSPGACMSYRCGSNCDQTYDRMHPCLACTTAEAADLRGRLAEALAPVAALADRLIAEDDTTRWGNHEKSADALRAEADYLDTHPNQWSTGHQVAAWLRTQAIGIENADRTTEGTTDG